MNYITASKLYDYIQCPHKVWRDIYGPKEEKIQETNPFVELLWDRGVKHEEEVVSKLGKYLNLKEGSIDSRFQKTIEAMKNKMPLIYQGVLMHGYLLGIPDLLKKLPDDTYFPMDIKSGSGFEGTNEEEGEAGKPKKHYALQLCLYNDLLNKLGFAAHRKGSIIDIENNEVEYVMTALIGVKNKESWFDLYQKTIKEVESLINNKIQNKPAQGGICKLCPWQYSCKKWCEDTKDLTNIFYLGRSNRDKINQDLSIDNIDDFIKIDVEKVMKLKEDKKKAGDSNFLLRVGKDSLLKSVKRAKILCQTKKPVAYEKIVLPKTDYELFFDIEDDPTQGYVYLHGIYERRKGKEKFIDFTAREISDTAEKEAWVSFWDYIESLPRDGYSVYYYSAHEKTMYKKLQKKYPDVISVEKVESFFANSNVIDLYSIVQKSTDWPLGSYSIKAIATYLGFKWRDETPSGALSIQWFNKYLETKDASILKRILEYNEDDCKATMILKDALEKLSV